MACCQSTVRTLENVPVLGHLIAACYACSGNRAKAQRAAIKSTAGILLAPVNVPAEAIDEATRERYMFVLFRFLKIYTKPKHTLSKAPQGAFAAI